MISSKIIRNFDAAAEEYDRAATVQAEIAKRLVEWSSVNKVKPQNVLDLGAGTGFVAEAIYKKWPDAKIMAVDASASMLQQAKKKLPELIIQNSNLVEFECDDKFDAIYSSMALHWLPDPYGALTRWQKWLCPNGKLFLSLPVEGSFIEWKNLCLKYGVEDGLWSFPHANFADDLISQKSLIRIPVTFPSARDFLLSLKKTGASSPRQGHLRTSTSKLRKIIRSENRLISLTYALALLELQEPDP